MNKTIERKLAALNKKAKEDGRKAEAKAPVSSSLHRVIKTKEQANLFMKLLKEA
ncbi:hypothetical protein [Niastella caeni]|uniref:hypothetical protein n=1 Tax=Niastella caeni TaxID=2569763 RepID=UPI00129A4C83|nr:hypothetical protein [Niastella caeni]